MKKEMLRQREMTSCARSSADRRATLEAAPRASPSAFLISECLGGAGVLESEGFPSLDTQLEGR